MKDARDEGRYEHADANPAALLVSGFFLALLLVGSLAASAWVTQRAEEDLRDDSSTSPVRALRTAPAGPELQAVPARELEEHRAWEERMLHGTEWVDAVNGVVRIPVERALELSLEEGFPVRVEDGQ